MSNPFGHRQHVPRILLKHKYENEERWASGMTWEKSIKSFRTKGTCGGLGGNLGTTSQNVSQGRRLLALCVFP